MNVNEGCPQFTVDLFEVETANLAFDAEMGKTCFACLDVPLIGIHLNYVQSTLRIFVTCSDFIGRWASMIFRCCVPTALQYN